MITSTLNVSTLTLMEIKGAHPPMPAWFSGPQNQALCKGSWWDIIPETFFFGPLFFLVGFFLVALGGPYAPKKNPMIVESPAIGIEGGY